MSLLGAEQRKTTAIAAIQHFSKVAGLFAGPGLQPTVQSDSTFVHGNTA